MDETPRIRKLDPTVINRIAAGEVVQRPVAAIKELLENSLDAGATTISVIVKHGGLELIQIQDNGHGIRKEDLEIVCERFTTSKLSSFDDLKSITTYGFRGEALASMTHVARVTITTRTKESACAYRAKYCDGKLVSSSGLSDKPEIKPTAGIIGTTISVEDLFYNMPTRKQAFKNASDEYQRILDVIAKYSIHFGDSNISFACKKHGKASADFFAPPSSSTLENIRLAYGIQVATDLLDVAYKSNSEELKFSMSGKVSKANYAGKKLLLILFINNRLVESSAIKKVIDAAYQDIIPKHSYPFVYLSIGIASQHVDVNVHPTKREVHFMYEDRLLEQLYTCLSSLLLNSNDQRNFIVNSLQTFSVHPAQSLSNDVKLHDKVLLSSTLPGSESMLEDIPSDVRENISPDMGDFSLVEHSSVLFPKDMVHHPKRQYDSATSDNGNESKRIRGVMSNPSKLVRVDPSIQRIDSFFKTSNSFKIATHNPRSEVSIEAGVNQNVVASIPLCEVCSPHGKGFSLSRSNCSCCGTTDELRGDSERRKEKISSQELVNVGEGCGIILRELEVTSCSYVSIGSLIDEIYAHKDSKLEELLRRHVYIGTINNQFSLLQYQTKLLMINHTVLLNDLFYQLCILRFAEMDQLKLEVGTDIKETIHRDFPFPEAKKIFPPTYAFESSEDLACRIKDVLVDKREMLYEYFRIGITDDGKLISLPGLIPFGTEGGSSSTSYYYPSEHYLGCFLLTIALETNWNEERDCFRDISIRIAEFYSKLHDNNADGILCERLFPAFRKFLIPQKSTSSSPTLLLEVTSLEQLYKVFERC